MTKSLHENHALETFKSLPTIAIEFLKALLLINGCAAVAMLAYLGQSPQGREIAQHAWWPLGLFAGGVATCAMAFFGAYLTQLTLYAESAQDAAYTGPNHERYLWPSVVVAAVSICCFVAGAMSSVYVLASHTAAGTATGANQGTAVVQSLSASSASSLVPPAISKGARPPTSASSPLAPAQRQP